MACFITLLITIIRIQKQGIIQSTSIEPTTLENHKYLVSGPSNPFHMGF